MGYDDKKVKELLDLLNIHHSDHSLFDQWNWDPNGRYGLICTGCGCFTHKPHAEDCAVQKIIKLRQELTGD